ncbi:hypothetical protein FRC09_011976 [Ceratobasidium sp. 395]|nr:hypothetical protein FRC09_011976 [Ceratobasidium sp. 395]
MDHYSYVDPVNSNLVCCICRNPFVAPTTSSTCGHTFCHACIVHALEVSPCCPIDRSQLGPTDLHLASAVVRNMVDELLVECPHASLGCAHTAQRHLIEAHIAACTFTPVPCPAPDCTSSVLAHHVDDHTCTEKACTRHLVQCTDCKDLASTDSTDPTPSDAHTAHCPARLVPCPHCATPTPYSELSSHTSTTCLSAPVACSLSHVGCAWTGPRSSLAAHPSSCAYEPLRAFFTTHHQRITDLERTVSSLREELDATKRSLGPWFRPANAPPPLEPEPPRFEFRPLVGRRRVSSPLHTSMFHFDDPSTSNGGAEHIGTSTSLAGRRRAGSGSRLMISTTNPLPADQDSSTTHETSTLDPFALPLPSPVEQPRLEAVPYVAPLNTHTSLEHTLSTLRNSLVSMAASLDMSERRQEVVVTTESLRMHEEVGAIRAIVHGLRMQVSALVMERNVQMMGRLCARTNSSDSARNSERGEGERWATETRYYNQPPPQPVNLAVPYSVRRQETNNKL